MPPDQYFFLLDCDMGVQWHGPFESESERIAAAQSAWERDGGELTDNIYFVDMTGGTCNAYYPNRQDYDAEIGPDLEDLPLDSEDWLEELIEEIEQDIEAGDG